MALISALKARMMKQDKVIAATKRVMADPLELEKNRYSI